VAALLLFTLLATLARTQRRHDESMFLSLGRH
jgi:cytochrome c oxidase assembly protein subunit 15